MKEPVQGLIKEIQLNGRFHSIDEAATKQAIIIRFLSYLGWDPYNLDQVSPEYSVGGGKIDYALRYKGNNKVFIEVKRVGEDLDKHQDQLLNYSFKAGVARMAESGKVNQGCRYRGHTFAWCRHGRIGVLRKDIHGNRFDSRCKYLY